MLSRRLQNRLSQRNFRERKSMYTIDLENQSNPNTVSESERNQLLLREARDLRPEMLQLRSMALKISVFLDAIGLQIVKILDIDGHPGQSLRRTEICSDFEDGLANSDEDDKSSVEQRFQHNMGC
ncbi:uncharacterized protein FMAN_08455 [Fusarium mangiferae]|uniref:BZIP domain-containing protein n=1 Tax=Fusarium mangiferae TaxID=192010 RepID=A0A1L7TJA0_FUSMA|nr:uncharacterized protein FMAN_08455 [Fusarium mangiferae]CVK98760.1 uncharacterized protein FMAN_08455 [Fusarium mangiferae]